MAPAFRLGSVKILHNLYNMDDISTFSAEVHPGAREA